MSDKEIQKLREKLDEIDLQLLYLLNKRVSLVIDLGLLKSDSGQKLYDPTRERDIFVRLSRMNPGPLSPEAVVRLFERVIVESRGIERKHSYNDKDERKP